MTTVAVGCTVAIQVSQTARASSPRLSTQLLKGSGLVLTAARVLAFVPCEVRATPPARSAALQRHSGGAATVALYARSAAAGGRVKVGTASQMGSTYGIFSARNLNAKSASGIPKT